MKINGTGPVQTSASRRKNAPKSPTGTRFTAELAPSSQPAGMDAARQIEALGGLLSLQEVSDPTEERRRGALRGEAILDSLDQIRMGLLSGRIPERNLRDLVKTLRDDSLLVSDPGLRGILDEIELRAAVELAKLDQSR